MAKATRPRVTHTPSSVQDPPQQNLLQTWDALRRAWLLAPLGALIAAGVLVWPYLRLGTLGLMVGTAGALLLLWRQPRWLLWHANLVLAYVVAALAATVALSGYRLGWGGSAGDAIASRSAALAALAAAFGLLLALWVGFPRQVWRAWQVGLTSAVWAARTAYAGYGWGCRAARASASGAGAVALGVRSGYRRGRVLVKALAVYGAYLVRRHLMRQKGVVGPKAQDLWQLLRAQEQAQTAQSGKAQEEAGPSAKKTKPTMTLPQPPAKGPAPRAHKGSNGLGGWRLPPTDVLAEEQQGGVTEEENLEKAELIEQTLADYGIEVTVEEIRPGPVVTQFGLVPGWVRRVHEVKERDKEGRPRLDRNGKPIVVQVEEKLRVRVDTILSREKDLAMTLAAKSLRFEAPVPGESFIGLEVPNHSPAVVTLRGVMDSPAFKQLQRKGRLPIALGKGSGGEAVLADLTDMPHLLIAGATGSGKSVCINVILGSLLMQATPLHVRFIMTDPKRVELTPYNGIPHLVLPVVVEPDETVVVLRGIVREMQDRFRRLEAAGVRNIQGFNSKAPSPEQRMPYLVVVIDELADLMMAAPVDVEYSLCRLAQLGRAIGIHLVVATQRPSVDVITGLIKANFPTRISFAVTSQVDSRTILDGVGAEKLLGRGDMLFSPVGAPKPKRVQGAFVSDEEIAQVVGYWKEQQGTSPPLIPLISEKEATEEDELLVRARDLAAEHRSLSASLLQRKMGIGYPRASRLLDRLEELGVVEPGTPGKSRQVIAQEDEPLETRE